MRLRNNPEAISILMQSSMIIKNFPFFLKKETIIELGMGKGEMLTTLANQNSNNIFIGVEKYATIAEKALKKAKTLNLKNFFIINADINKLDELFIGKVKTIWLTFSDPWPKARHKKRRLTYKTFLYLYENLLDRNGVIKLKTDNDKFFKYSIESFTSEGWNLKNVTYDFHSKSFSKDNIKTGYEIKWNQKGKKINYLEVLKAS